MLDTDRHFGCPGTEVIWRFGIGTWCARKVGWASAVAFGEGGGTPYLIGTGRVQV